MGSLISKKAYSEVIQEISLLDADTILFVIDESVFINHEIKLSFEKLLPNKKVLVKIVEGGEPAKSIESFEEVSEYFLLEKVHRNAHLIAIGGGAVSDMAGMVAATILRGIKWSVIPTTLLAMVDASIGGKVAINSKSGKNLIGNFHLPENIWIDTGFLSSLPEVEMNSGRGELIKYALLDKQIYQLIIDKESIDEMIMAAASFKEQLVEKDLFDKGPRKILNLGHTVGHALEKLYGLPHGIAIYFGMRMLTHVKELDEVAAKINFSAGENEINLTRDIDRIMDYIESDKKVSAIGILDIIEVTAPGDVKQRSIKIDEIKEIILRTTNEQ